MPRRERPGYSPGDALSSECAWISLARGHMKGAAQRHQALRRRGTAAASHPKAQPTEKPRALEPCYKYYKTVQA